MSSLFEVANKTHVTTRPGDRAVHLEVTRAGRVVYTLRVPVDQAFALATNLNTDARTAVLNHRRSRARLGQ